MEGTIDSKARESGHLMLITPERVFYAGLLGRPRERCSGAFHLYVAIKEGLRLTIAGGQEVRCELAIVPPNVRHTIISEYRSVLSILVEPESIRAGAGEGLIERMTGPQREAFVHRIRSVYEEFRRSGCPGGITTADFDTLCFGEPLPRRVVDARVVRAIENIGRFSGEPVTADSCATDVGLSASRFLHLFKEETGISFRSFRAWKRARHLLHFANQDLNLAHLAQDIGYPDSTHFSHSIRRFYGLKPRAIFMGSRDLAIYRSGQAA